LITLHLALLCTAPIFTSELVASLLLLLRYTIWSSVLPPLSKCYLTHLKSGCAAPSFLALCTLVIAHSLTPFENEADLIVPLPPISPVSPPLLDNSRLGDSRLTYPVEINDCLFCEHGLEVCKQCEFDGREGTSRLFGSLSSSPSCVKAYHTV
jgi:hypothetical protein